MNDDVLRHRILDVVLGAPDPEREKELEQSLAVYPELLREYEQLRNAWRSLGALPVEEPPRDSRDRAERALERAMAVDDPEKGRTGPRLSWPLAAAAAVVMFLAGAATGTWLQPTAEPVPTTGTVRPDPDDERRRYVLLIRGEAPTGDPDAGVAAMTEWARSLWSDEHLLWAERLFADASVQIGEETGRGQRGLRDSGSGQAGSRPSRSSGSTPRLGWERGGPSDDSGTGAVTGSWHGGCRQVRRSVAAPTPGRRRPT